jgi:hypothetical protein
MMYLIGIGPTLCQSSDQPLSIAGTKTSQGNRTHGKC